MSISVSDDAVKLFGLIKYKSHRWALWKIDESGATVVPAAVGEQDSNYADFLAALTNTDCRYGVFNYEYVTDTGKKDKLIFLNWLPDSARIKTKIMYDSNKNIFRRSLIGIDAEFNASDLSDIDEEKVTIALMKR